MRVNVCKLEKSFGFVGRLIQKAFESNNFTCPIKKHVRSLKNVRLLEFMKIRSMIIFIKPMKKSFILISDEGFPRIAQIMAANRKIGFYFKLFSKVKMLNQKSKLVNNFRFSLYGLVDQSK